MNEIEAQRAARRAAMPITSALLAEYADFSPKLIYAVENGIRVGKQPQDENAFPIPPLYRQNTHIERAKR
jgi:hypothetical protein